LNLSAYEIVTIAGGFTIIGALIGAWATYRLSIKLSQRAYDNAIDLMQRQEFNKAAAEFRNVFLPETTFLKHHANIGGLGSSNNLHEILNSGYLRQLKALEIFKSYLSSKERANIDKVWQEYCRRTDDPNVFYFEQYSTKNVSKEREKELKELALQKIEEILKFAKHK